MKFKATLAITLISLTFAFQKVLRAEPSNMHDIQEDDHEYKAKAVSFGFSNVTISGEDEHTASTAKAEITLGSAKNVSNHETVEDNKKENAEHVRKEIMNPKHGNSSVNFDEETEVSGKNRSEPMKNVEYGDLGVSSDSEEENYKDTQSSGSSINKVKSQNDTSSSQSKENTEELNTNSSSSPLKIDAEESQNNTSSSDSKQDTEELNTNTSSIEAKEKTEELNTNTSSSEQKEDTEELIIDPSSSEPEEDTEDIYTLEPYTSKKPSEEEEGYFETDDDTASSLLFVYILIHIILL